jgi:hypothetical protein
MGLILGRQIAEAHGGVLQLANRSDRQGCEAVLALPITYDRTGIGVSPWRRGGVRSQEKFYPG